MDIKYYAGILWRRKWIIVTTLIVTMVVVILVTLRTVPTYSSSVTMRISSATYGSIEYTDYMYAERLMNTYVKLATTKPVTDELMQRLGLSKLPKIEVNIIANTELIEITVDHNNPTTAATAANTLADILISQSLKLYSGSGQTPLEILSQQLLAMEEEVNAAQIDYTDIVTNDPNNTEAIATAKQMLDLKNQMYGNLLQQYEQTQLNESLRSKAISIVDPATPPLNPSKPNKIINIGLSFIVGLIGGIGLTFLFENIDTTLYSTEQIESATQLPILAKIPYIKSHNSFADLDTNFIYGESIRYLRTSILSAKPSIQTLLMTSADPQEGKSRIAADLAYTLGQSGREVVIVDCDLRVPSQYKIFKITNQVGLSTILEHKEIPLNEALQSSEYRGVHILPSGPVPGNPSELLASDQMKIILKQLAHIFDLVIIDAPAALAVSDVAVIAPLADAVVLVVNRTKTSSGKVRAVVGQFNKIDVKMIGVIINRAEPNSSHYYYYRNSSRSKKGPEIADK